MTVVSITDEMLERQMRRQMRRLGPWGALLVRTINDQMGKERIRSAGRDEPPASRSPAPAWAIGRGDPGPSWFIGRTEPSWAIDQAEPEVFGGVEFWPDRPPRFEIHLGYAGLEVIQAELTWGATEDVEVGGHLWTNQRANDRGLVVAHVSPAAANSQHSRNSVRLGGPWAVVPEWPEWLKRAGLRAAGDWHSHPSSNSRPSREDLAGWAAQARRSGAWAAVIVTRGPEGWSEPRLTGWLTSLAEDGRVVCESARVTRP